MTRSLLCRDLGIKQADLDVILADLEQEGRIKRTIGRNGEFESENPFKGLKA